MNAANEDRKLQDIRSKFQALIQIGISLTGENNLRKLLSNILTQARKLTNCDAGSLYTKQGEVIIFEISQNDTFAKRSGSDGEMVVGKEIPITSKSIAGSVALTGKVLSFSNVYEIRGQEFSFDPSFDQKNDYHTQSMLTAPMKDNEGKIVGVIQLINAIDETGKVVPFDPEDEEIIMALGSQASVAIKNTWLNENLKRAYLDTINRLSVAAEFRDKETGGHIKRMSEYSWIIAQNLGFSEADAEIILFSSPMHDIGKIGIPDAVLLKPGKLTPEERAVMEEHANIGGKILADSTENLIQIAQLIAVSHHEKWDGSGYPNKIKGEAIPIEGRIVALADVFDALSCKRCYKEPWPMEKVIEVIKGDSGTHFDPQVVEAFMKGLPLILKVYEAGKEL